MQHCSAAAQELHLSCKVANPAVSCRTPTLMPYPWLQVYFRSDKINMRPEEIAAKQEQATQLQDEPKRQIEEKRRIKVFVLI